MKVEALESKLAEIEAQIRTKPEILDDRPNAPALDARQKYSQHISSLRWDLLNTHEPMLADFDRKLAEERQKVSEMKGFSALAVRRLQDMKFSAGRLDLALAGDDIRFFEDTIDALSWWIDTSKERIRTQEAEVTRFEGYRKKKEREIATIRAELEKLSHELDTFDHQGRAELEAERQAVLGWSKEGEPDDEDGGAIPVGGARVQE